MTGSYIKHSPKSIILARYFSIDTSTDTSIDTLLTPELFYLNAVRYQDKNKEESMKV